MLCKMTDHTEPFEPHLILPVGTQVVTRSAIKSSSGEVLHPRGSVGVIIEVLPDEVQVYRIRFPGGGESVMDRQDFAVRKHLRQATLQSLQGISNEELYEHVIYRCIVGSRAYGLDND